MRGFNRIFIGGLAGFLALAIVPSCRKPGEAVKSDLGEAGYKITTDDWFRASRGNDVAALKKFIASGYAVGTCDKSGDSALHAAAAGGAVESADYLLDRGLAVDLRGAEQRTPLMSAVLAEQTAMVRWLLRQSADPKLTDKDGFDALMLAVRENKPGAVGELAPYQRDRLDSAILLAAMEGRTAVIDTLTNYGASVYARMEDGRTPLMIAAENGHVDAVKLLLDIGSGRLVTNVEGQTAADLAIEAGHSEIVSLIQRDPLPEELALDSPEDISKSMDAFVAAAVIDVPVSSDLSAAGNPPSEKSARNHKVISVPIQNEVLSAAVASSPTKPPSPELPRVEPASKPASAASSASLSFPLPPIVMRHYRERELPIKVSTVSGDTATLSIDGKSRQQIKVRSGDVIPGSRLTIVKVDRRMESSKLNEGKLMEVSVVEVRDNATGRTREWTSGVSSTAHDPIALVEDAATGRRYTATPGQRFKSADGAEFIVSDVRPNQIVIEDAASGAVQTIPLRGPRG